MKFVALFFATMLLSKSLIAQADDGVCTRTRQVALALMSQTGKSCDQISNDDLAKVKQLKLIGASLTTLSAGDFQGLTSLQSLNLADNRQLNLYSLPSGLFKGLIALRDLDLSFTEIGNIGFSAGFFDDLESLERLNLSGVNFQVFEAPFNSKNLPDGSFKNLHSLKFLEIGFIDSLQTFTPDFFDGLSNLEELFIPDGHLTKLPSGAFAKLTSLQRLIISGGIVGFDVESGAFSGLSSLQTLDLSKNGYVSLPENAFAGLTSLKIVKLSENRLVVLPKNSFLGLTNLEELDLSQNSIQNPLPGDIFAGLLSLKTLNMNYNSLDRLSDNIFSDLSKLENLNIANNPIPTLDDLPSSLFKLRTLKNLDLPLRARTSDSQWVAIRSRFPPSVNIEFH